MMIFTISIVIIEQTSINDDDFDDKLIGTLYDGILVIHTWKYKKQVMTHNKMVGVKIDWQLEGNLNLNLFTQAFVFDSIMSYYMVSMQLSIW